MIKKKKNVKKTSWLFNFHVCHFQGETNILAAFSMLVIFHQSCLVIFGFAFIFPPDRKKTHSPCSSNANRKLTKNVKNKLKSPTFHPWRQQFLPCVYGFLLEINYLCIYSCKYMHWVLLLVYVTYVLILDMDIISSSFALTKLRM